MLLVIGNIMLMGWILGLNKAAYLTREVFFCTVLYTFISIRANKMLIVTSHSRINRRTSERIKVITIPSMKNRLKYFGKWWQLVVCNFLYILGMYIHNFVFWTTDMRIDSHDHAAHPILRQKYDAQQVHHHRNDKYILGMYIHNFVFWTTDMRIVVVKSFVCNQPYDMATCLAMFTNISATIIFITRVEMYFHDKYKNYSESVIGGRGADIDIAKSEVPIYSRNLPLQAASIF